MVSHEVFNPAMDKQRVKSKANYNPKTALSAYSPTTHSQIEKNGHYVYNGTIISSFMQWVKPNRLIVKIFKVITTWDSNAVSSACLT
ncbi:Uncharacterised protein [Serratia quinivorans]|nr:Uncharacterised protein [Serratia quinivorans]CAI1611468.1 Uncharacterised protein [Serratia quinivorans]